MLIQKTNVNSKSYFDDIIKFFNNISEEQLHIRGYSNLSLINKDKYKIVDNSIFKYQCYCKDEFSERDAILNNLRTSILKCGKNNHIYQLLDYQFNDYKDLKFDAIIGFEAAKGKNKFRAMFLVIIENRVEKLEEKLEKFDETFKDYPEYIPYILVASKEYNWYPNYKKIHVIGVDYKFPMDKIINSLIFNLI